MWIVHVCGKIKIKHDLIISCFSGLRSDEYTYDRDQIPGLPYWGGHYWEWYQVSSLERGACFIDSLRTPVTLGHQTRKHSKICPGCRSIFLKNTPWTQFMILHVCQFSLWEGHLWNRKVSFQRGNRLIISQIKWLKSSRVHLWRVSVKGKRSSYRSVC